MDPGMPTTDELDGPRRPVEILLAEDNPADVAIIQQVLRRTSLNGNLSVVRDGEEVLTRLAGPDRPDLLLLDLNMPRLGGLEVIEQVKGDPRLRVIPVIVLTSSIAEGDVERAYRSHVNAYIRKPMDLHGLTRVVRAIEVFWCSVAVLAGHGRAGDRP
jgi:CheY-like chemotaxis protein